MDMKSPRTAFFSDAACEGHNVLDHPEQPERAKVVRERILQDFPSIYHISDVPLATEEQILRFHTVKHLKYMQKLFRQVQSSTDTKCVIDEDTVVMNGTEKAALKAAGSVISAVDMLMRPDDSYLLNAFCGIRPPGHHAEPGRAMGFCYFNNVAIAACHLLAMYPDEIHSVLILDFDVHHGNGTQHKFAQEGQGAVHYISTHQGPFFPYTGKRSELGTDRNILNLPLISGTRSRAYRQVFLDKVVPTMRACKPDFILLSAGFDGHVADPLADLQLTAEDYYFITQHAVAVASVYAKGRIVSVLEGGYHLQALADSVSAHVRALREAGGYDTSDGDVEALTAAFEAQAHVTPDRLRVVVHYANQSKLIVLETRSLSRLWAQCRDKFRLHRSKKKPDLGLYDKHGIVISESVLCTLASDSDLYLRP